VLGLSEPPSPGVADWLASPTADGAALMRLAVPANHSLDVLPLGDGTSLHTTLPDRWSALASAIGCLDQRVVVDAGVGCPPAPLIQRARASLLVTRSCYLSLRRVVASGTVPTGIVLLSEPGRALSATDIEQAVGAPVVAQVPYDPAISRAVDAGLLAARLPSSLSHSLRRAA
jgi:hypothetical protein